MNSANFRSESFVAPGQVLTFIGANFPADAALLFDYVISSGTTALICVALLYSNGAGSRAHANRGAAGCRRRCLFQPPRVFRSQSEPTVRLLVTSDGRLVDRGNPVADVRLSEASNLHRSRSPGTAGDPWATTRPSCWTRSVLPGNVWLGAVLKVRDQCCGRLL